MSQWPQYTYLALVILSLGMSIEEHGNPRKPANAWAAVIGVAVSMWLLYMGGFFKGLA